MTQSAYAAGSGAYDVIQLQRLAAEEGRICQAHVPRKCNQLWNEPIGMTSLPYRRSWTKQGISRWVSNKHGTALPMDTCI
jgi:hypothetical protein